MSCMRYCPMKTKKSESETSADSSKLRRLTRDSSGVATVNIRASQILVYWASHATLAPVEAGWYLHAAWVAGRNSEVDGERCLDAEFDLEAPEVRWQHARVNRLSWADLFLEKE